MRCPLCREVLRFSGDDARRWTHYHDCHRLEIKEEAQTPGAGYPCQCPGCQAKFASIGDLAFHFEQGECLLGKRQLISDALTEGV